jgi:(p)ppGpp synthase/HD superfamily hydrolase
MSGIYSPILERAIRTASEFHRTQTRKGSALPYISHSAGVMLILQRAGFDDDRLLAAAVLHDAVEDTDCTFEMLGEQFPPEVVGWVSETSERKLDEAGTDRSWIDRKREHLAHAASASFEARAIILADKYHNLYSMLYDLQQGETVWERFNAPAEHVLWYNREMIEAVARETPELNVLKQAALEALSQLISKSKIEPCAPAFD